MSSTSPESTATSTSSPTLELEKHLFKLYIHAKHTGTPMEWEEIENLDGDHLTMLDAIPEPTTEEISALLKKLVVIKLNGGLGTSMGCKGPKSILHVCDQLSFLDLTIQQIQTFNEKFNCNIPLLLMNSFNTDTDTQKILSTSYSDCPVKIYTFSQHRLPRLIASSGKNVPDEMPEFASEGYYPPGHGDIYRSLAEAPFFEDLLENGYEYAFMSNIDNMGALIHPRVIHAMDKGDHGFLMEVTAKTVRDIKGGMPILYGESKIKLLETAQVPAKHMGEFCSISKFKIFNTNNLYFSLPILKKIRTADPQAPHMDIIINSKKLSDGTPVIQLEQACGSAIQAFPNPLVVEVPRDRFLPVKSTSDLFVLQSDLFTQKKGNMTVNHLRGLPELPFVKLGTGLQFVEDYKKAFHGDLPNLIDLIQLVVSGRVQFGKNVTLKGNVFISSTEDYETIIPDDAVLENCFVVNGHRRGLGK